MAKFDINDCFQRLLRTLPDWFGDEHPLLDGTLQGPAYVGSAAYAQISYIKLQTRIQTATDINLDQISIDYFGEGVLPRSPFESDTSYRARILAFLVLERATRPGMINALTILTGNPPILFEPARDGAYWGNFSYDLNPPQCSYGAAIGQVPFTFYITVFLPLNPLPQSNAAYGINLYYNANSFYALYPDSYLIITPEQATQLVNAVKPAATVAIISFNPPA